ncbi:MAG: hypothetical protein RIS17_1676, partial [Pseudomonadota bacterium]
MKTKPRERTSALTIGMLSLVSAGLMAVEPASAAIVYQDLPTSLATPPNISFHNAFGPVIADDFVPVASTHVNQLTWWGSRPQTDQWEIVLQNNNAALGQPANTPPGNNVSGGLKQLVTATMS